MVSIDEGPKWHTGHLDAIDHILWPAQFLDERKDGKNAPIELSLDLLEALHQRWVFLLDTLTDKDLDKKYYHPDSQKHFELRFIIGMYAWHGRHHTTHITELRKRMEW